MNVFGSEDGGTPALSQHAPAKWSELQIGKVLDGRFKILHVVDRGGMAEIYEAFDQETGHRVALKVPLAQFENEPLFLARFEREEIIGVTLHHPNVLQFMSVGTHKSRAYIVTEFIKGETLAVRLLRESPVPEAEAVRIASQI